MADANNHLSRTSKMVSDQSGYCLTAASSWIGRGCESGPDVDCAGNSTTLRLKDYLSRKIQPKYEVLPWQGDVALASAKEKSKLK